MDIQLAYGKNGLQLTLPDDLNVSVITSDEVPSLDDPVQAMRDAVQDPIGTPPLAELVAPQDTVAIVFSDITRPTPNHLILPVILEALAHVPTENITLCNALGTHRPNTQDELISMLGADIVNRYRIIQNDSFDRSTQVYLGTSTQGHEQWINREYMQADKKILTGFIEPHFFAGFSGGGKAVMPGMAGQQTVLGNHDAGMIANPKSIWGITHGNPIFEEAREIARRTDPTFLLNVTLNSDKHITGVFAGALEAAHDAGIAFARRTAMVPVSHAFDIVVSTNSGYPLDQNLYQSGKGMGAAEKIVKQGGAIILAAECSDGIPDHGLYGQMVKAANSPQELFETIMSADQPQQDQWAGQIQAKIQMKAEVYIYADGLTDEQIREALLSPCTDIAATIETLLERYGHEAEIGILPQGPQVIPYIQHEKPQPSSERGAAK